MRGLSLRARIMLLGRLPSITLCGASHAGTPSASISACVLPKASASACANTLAVSRSWCVPMLCRLSAKAMKSQGTILVP